jgi:hypothetical protein
VIIHRITCYTLNPASLTCGLVCVLCWVNLQGPAGEGEEEQAAGARRRKAAAAAEQANGSHPAAEAEAAAEPEQGSKKSK